MSLLLRSLIVLAGGVALYAYAVYPLMLQVIGWIRRFPTRWDDLSEWPTITVTICAYNEEMAIGAALDHVLALDYPADRQHILVVSDGSTDRTDEIVRSYADRGVELLRLEPRGGKTAAENAAWERVRGEIVVNVDASVRIPPDALKPLVSAFGDPSVGIASGRDESVAESGADANRGETTYVGYEMWVRELETRAGGVVGASGCFYASRRELHGHLVPEALSRDFAAPLIAKEHGYRAVSVHEAVCFVPRVASLKPEYRRKVRTMARGLETLFFKRHLLNPFRYGQFAWMLFSHKLARWLVPWAFLLATIALAMLAVWEVWARVLVLGGFVLLAGGLMTLRNERHGLIRRVAVLPAFVAAGTVAGLHAWVKAGRRDLNPIWEPTRRTVGKS